MTKEERLLKQKERAMELKQLESKFRPFPDAILAGVDEVGRGPLAGPVVTACVILRPEYEGLGIDDSKKLTEKKREALYDEIIENSLAYGFGIRDNERIDQINILEATKEAMRDAVLNVEKMLKKNGLGDSIDLIMVDAIKIPGINNKQMSLIKGDANSISIAAASILAKVKRDRMMVEYDRIYPGYDFASNKGYGTASHYKGIREQGMTPIHRRTFLKTIH